ncbi:hypothetical protein KPL47_19280 [Clostridium estertheticum]|uniref:hypothetical protein n=1 Tax=Clostridium estertheticum TaxID=238834 RepID=UPI001C0D0EA5|nr:hypothetical protein [Clostridium estertheticum]MBU3178468.1 hypothetical protein [Clostridium estertheticum]
MISESPYIVEAVQIGEQTETNYTGVTFVTNKLKIKQVLKGDLISANDVITLLQTQINEDPIVKKNGHVLLYLEKYSGSIVKDAYVCKGLYQGHYDISDNGTLVNSFDMKNLNPDLNEDLKKNNKLKDLTTKIKHHKAK